MGKGEEHSCKELSKIKQMDIKYAGEFKREERIDWYLLCGDYNREKFILHPPGLSNIISKDRGSNFNLDSPTSATYPSLPSFKSNIGNSVFKPFNILINVFLTFSMLICSRLFIKFPGQ